LKAKADPTTEGADVVDEFTFKRWNKDEHKRFVEAMRIFGRDWN